MKNFPLKDAQKRPSIQGFAWLEWDFRPYGASKVPKYSIQMAEEAVDKILEWRDRELEDAH